MASPFSDYRIKCVIAMPIFIEIHKGNLFYALSFTYRKSKGFFFLMRPNNRFSIKYYIQDNVIYRRGIKFLPVKRWTDTNAGIDLGCAVPPFQPAARQS